MTKPKLMDQLRNAICYKHYSIKTEESYLCWVIMFIFFHNKRHPLEMGKDEVNGKVPSLINGCFVRRECP